MARADVARFVRGLVEAQGLDWVDDTTAGFYRVRAREPRPQPAAPFGALPQAVPGALELAILHLKHAKAADVAATVNLLYGKGSALGEAAARESGAGRTLSQELAQNVIPAMGPPGAPGSASGTVVQGRPGVLSGDVTIVPDRGTNTLLIRATRVDFEIIRDLVKEIDIRPLQVLIEVVIAEISRSSSFQFGVGATVPQSAVNSSATLSAGGQTTGLGLGDFVLRVMNVGGGIDFDATLRASAARGEARILSRPVLIASNNEAASILVGSQRPFVQVERALPTESSTRDQVVQYKEVGTRLSIRPTISADGYVALNVTQEVSSATAEQQFNAPIIATRSVQTTLMVRDSQTIVLGGLADRSRESTQGGIPILSRIPLLGGLFGRSTRQGSDTEFFLFLTPRIIRSDAEADALTKPIKSKSDLGAP